MRILVVEDDKELSDILERGLKEKLYTVDTATDGETGLHLALTEDFDLILLDIMLPKLDGIGVCNALRSRGKVTPVIMLTARDSVEDRVLGLDAGADDYVVKPFAVSELFARIRALMRRVETRLLASITVGSLCLDPATEYVVRGDRKIMLTAKEFALLQFFMQSPNRVLSRTEILENIWDANYDGLGNVVDVYVNYLRNKLEAEGESRLIETVRGRGYVLKESDDTA